MNTENMLVEAPLTTELFAKATQKAIPLNGTFELTPICNFDCNMCYIHKSAEDVRQHSRRMLYKEDWLKIAGEAKKEGLLYLLLTGGEPFLVPYFWELYEELVNMGFLISINTNGSLINKDVVERLKKNPPIRINISLYGTNNETYKRLCHIENGFTKVDEAITNLKAAGIEVKLNGSLTPENADDLESCIKYAEERELIYEPCTYMFPPVRRDETAIGKNNRFTPAESAYYRAYAYRLQYGEERYHFFMQSIIEGKMIPMGLESTCEGRVDGSIRCRAGRASFWVTWDGYMTPCGMMSQPKKDLKKKSFSECWMDIVSCCRRIKLSGVCNTCPSFRICSVCAAMAISETGNVEKIPMYLCHVVEELRRLAQLEIEGKTFPDKPLSEM